MTASPTYDPGIVGHRIATEVVRRVQRDKALGEPSLYNIVRETVAEMTDDGTAFS